MRQGRLTFTFATLSVAFVACSSDGGRSGSPSLPDASIGGGGANAGGSAAAGTSSNGGSMIAPSNGGRSKTSNGGTGGTSPSGGQNTSSSAGSANAAGSATDSGIPSDAGQDGYVPRRICDPGLVVSPGCSDCERTKCAGDAATQRSCEDYPSAQERAACTAVLDCVRRTNCLDAKDYGCYCGSLDYETCMFTDRFTPNGACANEILAGLPANVDPSDYAVVSNRIDVSHPTGGALALARCDSVVCGQECDPYCRPPGATGRGGWGGSAGVPGSGGIPAAGGIPGIGGSTQ